MDASITDAVMQNLQSHQRGCEWTELADALQGPAHVVKKLIWYFQKRRSTPERQYTFNAEQLEYIALFVSRLEEASAKRPEVSQPWIHPACAIMTVITDGRG